jgi:hypothetical protein
MLLTVFHDKYTGEFVVLYQKTVKQIQLIEDNNTILYTIQ